MVAKQVVQRSHGVAAERLPVVKPPGGNALVMSFNGEDTTSELKHNIEHKTHISANNQYLIINIHHLDNGRTV